MRNRRPTPFLGVLLGLAVAFTAGLAAPVRAADWFVAPLTSPPSSAAPSGSEADPFATVNAAFKSGKIRGGDRILLKDGPHGTLLLRNAAFDAQVTIMSQTGSRAQIDSALIDNASRNIRLFQLSVWPTDPSNGPRWLVLAMPDTSDIVVERLTIRSERGEATKFASWDAAMWEARKFSGIRLDGPRSTAVRNNLMGIAFGITLRGNDSQAISNTINFYNGDGLRGLGNNNVFRWNRVFNCIKTDHNHADGFQSFAGASGSVAGLVLDSNIIIEWTLAERNHPLRCRLQGVGLFDGFYDNLTIINNLVATTQYHGISVYGARGAVIVNNTVVHAEGLTGLTPYIGVRDHKNGTPTSDVLVANNVAMSFTGVSSVDRSVTFKNNSVVGTPGAVFQNPSSFDYRPKTTSGFIDTADMSVAPPLDMLNQRRPSGAGPDRGSYETMVGGPSASMTAVVTQAEGEGEGEIAAETGVTVPDTTAGKWTRIPGH